MGPAGKLLWLWLRGRRAEAAEKLPLAASKLLTVKLPPTTRSMPELKVPNPSRASLSTPRAMGPFSTTS